MKGMRLVRGIVIFITIVAAIPYFSLANAQTSHWLNIESITDAQFPQIEAHLTALNPEGFPIQGLTPSNFSVFEDGQKVGAFDVASFMSTEKPLAIALVIDTSYSMANGSTSSSTTPTALQSVVQSAKAFVDNLSPNDNAAVISFSTDVKLVQDLTTDKTLLDQALDSLKPEHDTALYEGIAKGIDVLKNRAEKRVLVLLTDGTETIGTSPLTIDQVAKQAQDWSIPVYSIGFGQQVKQDELQKLATTGGVVQIQPDASTFQSAFTSIYQILRQQYKLTFKSALASDGKAHPLLIGLDYQDKHDEVSRTFMAQLPTTIQIIAPAQGDSLKDNSVQIKADAYARTGVKQVELTLDGQTVSGAFTSQPYEYQWDLTNVTVGSHKIGAVLTATDGSTAQAQVEVLVLKPVSTKPPDFSWVIGLVVLAVAAVLIPVSLRSRRKRAGVMPAAQARQVQATGACLRELEGMNPGQVWPLGSADVHLGRKREENDIPLQGLSASRKQAVIRFEQGQYVIHTLNPGNPVAVNGNPAPESQALKPGDTLQLGETLLRYEQ
jgi:VWFA-related protein